MSFLSPLLLFGALAIAAPIIIHLLARRQIKRVPWAAMRFLKAAVERNQRRMNIEDIILMCIRCLLLLLLALALARPALRKGSALGFRGRDEVAIILIDASLSMAQSDGVQSIFEQAQESAEEILNALPAGTPTAAWLVTEVVDPLTSEPTKDSGLNRKLIRDAKRTDRSADWPPALRRALDKLSTQSASVKHLFIITDGQAHGWHAPAEVVSLIKESGKGVITHLLLTGESDTRNIAVTDVRLASALPVVNESIQFEAEVTNFGSHDVSSVSLSIAPDADTPTAEQVIEELKAGGKKRATLTASFREPGLHTVTVRQNSDRCPADDARTFAIRVLDEINVLLVDGESGGEPRDSEVFYLRHALAPVAPEARDRYVIKTRIAAEAELPTLTFGSFDVVVLANVVDLPPAVADSLVNYVGGGGGLMIFPGERMNLAFYNDSLHRDYAMLPANFGEVRGNAEDTGQFTTLHAQDYAHPIVSLWNDPAAGSLASAHFYRSLRLVPGQADLARKAGQPVIVLRYSDSEPAIVERTFGNGRVIQFSSTADSAWNDFCVRPLFVPFIHHVLGALIGRQDSRINIRTGSAFTSEVPLEFADKTARVSLSGESIDQARAVPIRLSDGSPRLTFDHTDLGGGYEVRIGDDAAPTMRFAAHTDPSESDLAQLSPADLKALEPIAHVTRSSGASDLRGNLTEQRNGVELWLPLAWLALGLTVAETILGNRWSRSK